jgi:ABC-type nitrate/sulfonate/bicarbonate transport system permease component
MANIDGTLVSTTWNNAITPNEYVPNNTARWILVGWLALWLAYWTFFKPAIFPTPLDVVEKLPDLWTNEGLGQELAASFTVNLEALFFSTLLSLPLAYLCLTPIIRPVALIVSKLRFLSPAVFFLLLLFATNNGHQIKVTMLMLGEAFFLVTTMVGVVESIPKDDFDDARTLRMNEWQVTWYVVVRGTLVQAIDAVRDNAAMGWSSIMFVEGFVQSEGGLGVVILKHQKTMDFAVVYAIAGIVVITGLLQDYALVWLRQTLCPYAEGT